MMEEPSSGVNRSANLSSSLARSPPGGRSSTDEIEQFVQELYHSPDLNRVEVILQDDRIGADEVNEALTERAGQGNTGAVDLILKHRYADLNYFVWTTTNSETPLLSAVFSNNVAMVRHLIERGADVNEGTTGGFTPLQLAAKTGSLEIFEYLEQLSPWTTEDSYRLAFYFIDDYGRHESPLTIFYPFPRRDDAKDKGRAEILEYLATKHGLDTNWTGSDGTSLLHCALRKGNDYITEFLLANGANPLARDRTGMTAWEAARRRIPTSAIYKFIDKSHSSGAFVYTLGSVIPHTGYFVFTRKLFSWPSTEFVVLELRKAILENRAVWVNFRQNNDSVFTATICRVCHFSGYGEDSIAQILRLLAEAFREQDAVVPRLRFREPSCDFFSVDLVYDNTIQATLDSLTDPHIHMELRDDQLTDYRSSSHQSSAHHSNGRTSQRSPGSGETSAHEKLEEKAADPLGQDTSPVVADATSPLLDTQGVDGEPANNDNRGSPSKDTSNKSLRVLKRVESQGIDEADGNRNSDQHDERAGDYCSDQPISPIALRQPLVQTAGSSSDRRDDESKKKLKTESIMSIVIPYFHAERQKSPEEDKPPRRTWLNRIMNVHLPRSLDESYYLGLNDEQLLERNKTQVISRRSEKEGRERSLLMVPQLWMWTMNQTVVTTLPMLNSAHYPQVNEHISEQLNALRQRIRTDLSGEQLAAFILSECINFLDRPCMAGLSESVFYTFEKTVAITFDEAQVYMSTPGARSMDIEREREFIHEIRDVRDELAMIKNILAQQEEVWDTFWDTRSKTIWNNDSANPKIRPALEKFTDRPKKQLARFKLRVQKIDEDAERVERYILAELDLKAKHAALRESYNSTTLGTAVIGFTVITIIFTPLSFLSSLFALPITQFPTQQGGGRDSGTFSTAYIGKWMTVGEIVSLIVTGMAVWLSLVFLKRRERSAFAVFKESLSSLRNNFMAYGSAILLKAKDDSQVPPKQAVDARKLPATMKKTVSRVKVEPRAKAEKPTITATPKMSNFLRDLLNRSKNKNPDPER